MNLKAAAHQLGVHYQTAYKWVRSGALTAVRVGGRYEISDAAIEQFQANRRSMVADIPGPRRQQRFTDLTEDDVLDELEAMALDPILTVPSAIAFAARRGAAALGDLCIVSLVRDDGTLGHGVVDHAEPDRAAFVGAIARSMSTSRTVAENATMVPLASGVPLRIPHVRQDEIRKAIRPELHQHLPKYSIYSLLAVPIMSAGKPVGTITFARDTPARPYTDVDEQFAVQVATRLGWLIQSARELKQAWKVRNACIAAIETHLAQASRHSDDGRHTPDGTELERVLASVPETIDVPVAILDPWGRMLASSEPMRRFSGWSTSMLNASNDTLTHSEDIAEARAAVQRLVSGEITYLDSHARRRRADGVYVDCATHRAAIRDRDASLICIVTVVRPLHTPRTLRRQLASVE